MGSSREVMLGWLVDFITHLGATSEERINVHIHWHLGNHRLPMFEVPMLEWANHTSALQTSA